MNNRAGTTLTRPTGTTFSHCKRSIKLPWGEGCHWYPINWGLSPQFWYQRQPSSRGNFIISVFIYKNVVPVGQSKVDHAWLFISLIDQSNEHPSLLFKFPSVIRSQWVLPSNNSTFNIHTNRCFKSQILMLRVVPVRQAYLILVFEVKVLVYIKLYLPRQVNIPVLNCLTPKSGLQSSHKRLV